MSDEEEIKFIQTESGQILEYKDGQLQLVEVTPFDKGVETQTAETSSDGEQTKYIQVLDSNKSLMNLDLLNFTLVNYEDGDNTSYQVVGSADDGDTTFTCVLAEDNDDSGNHDSYVMMNTDEGKGPIVFLQSTLPQVNTRQNSKQDDGERKEKALTPAEILEKAKALQKTKAFLQSESANRSGSRGRKRKSDLPPPMELLASPNFKLYLYSCKLCSFKCNAIKEMSQHKAEEHASCKSRGSGSRSATLQCARCPYRAALHSQLMKHVQEVHVTEQSEHKEAEEEDSDSSGELKLDAGDMTDADVLVCGACGFESGDKSHFKKHIQQEHGINVTLRASTVTVEEVSYTN